MSDLGITPIWPERKVAILRELWAAGFSARKIGSRIGMSASSVIGKAHRLHLAPRPSPIKHRPPGAPREGRTVTNGSARGTHALPVGAGALPALQSETPLMAARDLPHHEMPVVVSGKRTCQWIEGDPRVDATMCGLPTLEGSSYCPPHHARCWTTRPTWNVQTAEIGLPDPMRDGRADARSRDGQSTSPSAE